MPGVHTSASVVDPSLLCDEVQFILWCWLPASVPLAVKEYQYAQLAEPSNSYWMDLVDVTAVV